MPERTNAGIQKNKYFTQMLSSLKPALENRKMDSSLTAKQFNRIGCLFDDRHKTLYPDGSAHLLALATPLQTNYQ
jgi:hypothetical protein